MSKKAERDNDWKNDPLRIHRQYEAAAISCRIAATPTPRKRESNSIW